MDLNNIAARAAEEHAHLLDDYRSALSGVGPKTKELILERAAHDRSIGVFELRDLVKEAYPDGA